MASDSESTSHLSPKRPHQSPQTSPTKRPNTLTHKPCDGTTTPLNSEPQSCGICLSEDGKTIRGCIDSCDHYFCFVCVMEWAKVESRCPMCKRRFSTIRRPPKCGVFLTERVVNVPVRDQVYHCFGNATLVSSNPYSEVRCTMCKSEADESLLLLCDLCDSAAHTYCVGLGATVPEGDWFCQDCTVTKAEHEKTETDRDCESQTSSSNIHKRPVAEAHVSIYDIVRESRFREVERPTTVSLLPNELSSPVVPERSCLADGMTEQGSRTGARTLKRCRNVHGRIRSLRENWNAFRSGSLRFSSSLVDSRVTENQRNSSVTILRNSSGQPHSIACSSQQLDAKKSSSFNKMPNRSPCVVDKAWKMMDVAKSVERARERTSVVHQASKHPFSKVSNLKEKTNASSNLLASSSKLIGTKNPANSGPQNNYQFHSPVEGNERHMSQMVLKQKNSIIITESILKFCESSPSAQSLSKHELPSSTNVQTSFQLDVHCTNGGKPSEKFLPGTSSGVFNKHDESACLISPAKSVTAASNTCAELDVSSSSKMKLSNGKATMEKSCAGKKSTSDDDAKSEIQSLVKLNLKLLSIDRTLGVDAFKEIARLATHSILAACGLERPKPGVRSFSSTVCCHTNQVQQLRMSTLMPTSCRECFYVFVKDVVNTIMFEKIGCTKMSS